MSKAALHVLVIAHPDDESMFFVPTLRALKDETVWIICLTTGDFDGLGKIRSKEIQNAGKLLNADKVLVCDRLKDHPTNRWDIVDVEQEIETTLSTAMHSSSISGKYWHRIVLITFDRFGVSGHVNHVDTYSGVCGIASQGTLNLSGDSGKRKNTIPVRAWSLISERNIVRKYFPILSWVLLLLSFFQTKKASHHNFHDNSFYLSYRLHEPTLNWKAMATHKSQFVWYRRLFVVFSCYTYVNRLQQIPSRDIKAR